MQPFLRRSLNVVRAMAAAAWPAPVPPPPDWPAPTGLAGESDRARALYLDLLIRVLINSVYRDADTSTEGRGRQHDPASREVGRDWPVTAHSMIGRRRMESLRDLAETALRDGIPGDFIETGVWRGGACVLMRGILAAYGERERRVHVADSFAGLPPPDPRYPADANDKCHEFSELAISRAQVEDTFRSYGLLDEQVAFHEGWFKDTLHRIPTERFAVIRLDGDMYESTIQALDTLYPRLSPGGFCIIDDYALDNCRAAVTDFRAREGIDEPIERVDWTGVWWRKRRG